jgi:transposase
MERTMKLQEVILKAMAKKISWMEAAEIAGVTDRTMRRIRGRYEEFGYTGLFDQRRGREVSTGFRCRRRKQFYGSIGKYISI